MGPPVVLHEFILLTCSFIEPINHPCLFPLSLSRLICLDRVHMSTLGFS